MLPHEDLEPREEEEKRLRLLLDTLRKEAAKVQERVDQIRAERHRLQLLALVNVPGGVQARFRLPAGARGAELNDQKGTLLQIRRSRATVVFSGEKWRIPLNDVLPVGETQGMTILF